MRSLGPAKPDGGVGRQRIALVQDSRKARFYGPMRLLPRHFAAALAGLRHPRNQATASPDPPSAATRRTEAPRSPHELDPPRTAGVGQFFVAKVGQFLVAIDTS